MNERWQRQSFLGAGSDQILANLKVAIIGLGGGGSHIAQQLAHLGVGRYSLFDPDTIEASNLNRLVGGTVSDVDTCQGKTAIAERQIRGILPWAQIDLFNQKWQFAAECLRDCDIIFGCVDTFSQRRQLEEATRRFIIPYIDIGMDVINDGARYAIVGQVALSMPGRPCLRCMSVVRDSDIADEAQRYGVAGGNPQVIWANGVLASVAVGIAIQLVLPWHDNHVEQALLEYDGNRGTIVRSNVLNDLPPTCPHFSSINSLGDPWFSLTLASANGIQR